MLMSQKIRWTCCIAIMGLAVSQGFAATLHVNPSDATAFKSIQKAIDSAKAFDIIVVHAGVYKESINYKGKPITVMSVDPNDPNVVAGTVIDGNGANAVLFQNAETDRCILRGLSVKNGKNGIDCVVDSRPSITQCVISANSASGISSGSATITQCQIHSNGDHGIAYCTGVIRECMISENHGHGLSSFGGKIEDSAIVRNSGFGVNAHQGSSTITRCMVSGNGSYGIYLLNVGTKGEVKNSIISKNGNPGVYVNGASAAVTNCTVVGNVLAGVQVYGSAKATLTNNIIAWNQGHGITGTSPATSMTTSRYNDVFANQVANYGPGVVPGEGDMHEHPWFAVNGYWDTDGWHEGDYHLLSTSGRWDPAANAWVTDPVSSPCIDKGDPNTPVGDEYYPNGDRINLGAYGGTIEASQSVAGPECVEFPAMDFNRDCKVDQADLDLFMTYWLECGMSDPNACWPDGAPTEPPVVSVEP